MIHCPLIGHSTIKEKAPKTQDITNYTQIIYENHSLVHFFLISFSLTNLSNEGGLADWLTPHRRVTLPPSSFCKFSIYRDNPIHSIVHLLRRGAQLLVFSVINGIYHQLTLFSLISLQIGGLKLDGPREKTIGPTIISSIFFLIFTLPFSILLIFTPTNQTLSDAHIILLYHNLENTKSKTRKQKEESLP